MRLFSTPPLVLLSLFAISTMASSVKAGSPASNTVDDPRVIALYADESSVTTKKLASALATTTVGVRVGANRANSAAEKPISETRGYSYSKDNGLGGISRHGDAVRPIRISAKQGATTIRRSNGDLIVECRGANDTTVLTAATAAARGAWLVIVKGQTCVGSDITIPNLRIEEGGLLKPVTSHTVTLSGNFSAGPYQVFTNALPGQGTVSISGNKTTTEIIPQWWGATGDGTSDDTAALNQAFAQVGQGVFVPKGSYKTTATLASPVCSAISGAGRDSTIFLPSATVKAFMKVYSGVLVLRGFQVDGAATANATGLLFGDGTSFSPWGGQVEMVRIRNFRGASGVGVRIADALKSSFTHVTVEGCGIDLLAQRITGGYPTTITFRNCQFNTATTKGVKLVDGHSLIFDGCVFESNAEEGVILLPNAGGTLENIALVNGCWFEDNSRGDPRRFQFAAGDGTGLGHATIRPIVRDAFFAGANGTAKAINLNGSAVAGFVIDNVQVPHLSDEIKIENGAYGMLSNFPGNLDASVVVSSTSDSVHLYGRGQIRFPVAQNPSSDPNTLDDYREGVFTPTLVLGGGTVTYSQQTGSYTKIGRLVTVQILITIKVATKPSGSLEVRSLPFAASAGQKGAVSIQGDALANAPVTCLVGTVIAGDSAIRVHRFDAGALVNPGSEIQDGTTLSITATYEANHGRP